MDETTVRQQLEEIKLALKKNEDEHEVLLNLFHGYEGWLRLHGYSNGNKQPPLIDMAGLVPTNKPKGSISFRGAVRQVLVDARGIELHAKEILRRIEALGVITQSKDPLGLVDLNCYSLQKDGAQKVAPRTWRWTLRLGTPQDHIDIARSLAEGIAEMPKTDR